jgi:hypothetical protein
MVHPAVPPEHVESASKAFTAGILSAVDAGAFESNDTWNVLLPDYKFENAEEYLRKAWQGKP